jgi:hypothetical protein
MKPQSQKIVASAPANHPKTSWWIGMTREQFAQHLAEKEEQERIRNSEHGRTFQTIGWAEEGR